MKNSKTMVAKAKAKGGAAGSKMLAGSDLAKLQDSKQAKTEQPAQSGAMVNLSLTKMKGLLTYRASAACVKAPTTHYKFKNCRF